MAHPLDAPPRLDIARFFVPDVAPSASAAARVDRPITAKQLMASSRVRAWVPPHLMDEFLRS